MCNNIMMKSLKLDHQFAQQVLAGKRLSTWRINDDKDLHVNEEVKLIDKVNSLDPSSWVCIGVARITSILEKQLGKVNEYDIAPGEQLRPIKDLLEEYRGYYGFQVNIDTPVKIITFSFTPRSSKTNNVVEDIVEMSLYSDGGSRGNPGPSACGFVLLDNNNNVVLEHGVSLGVTTNNQAEYQSLKQGLEAALGRGVNCLTVYMDSMLVINQMKGIYKVRNADLKPIHAAVKNLASKFKKISFNYIPRERNRLADAIVNEVLDALKSEN